MTRMVIFMAAVTCVLLQSAWNCDANTDACLYDSHCPGKKCCLVSKEAEAAWDRGERYAELQQYFGISEVSDTVCVDCKTLGREHGLNALPLSEYMESAACRNNADCLGGGLCCLMFNLDIGTPVNNSRLGRCDRNCPPGAG